MSRGPSEAMLSFGSCVVVATKLEIEDTFHALVGNRTQIIFVECGEDRVVKSKGVCFQITTKHLICACACEGAVVLHIVGVKHNHAVRL